MRHPITIALLLTLVVLAAKCSFRNPRTTASKHFAYIATGKNAYSYSYKGYLGDCYRFDPNAEKGKQWKSVKPYPIAVWGASAVPLGSDKALVVGGDGANGALAKAYVYDVKADTWTSVRPYPIEVCGASVDGSIRDFV